MSILFCKGCGNQLRKFNKGGKKIAKLVLVKKNKKGKWVEVINKEPKEGVDKDEKIFFKCLNCDFLNELPEYISRKIQKIKKTPLHPKI